MGLGYMRNLLIKAKEKIEVEINSIGYIFDCDNSDRFLDNVSKELASQEILQGNDDIDFYYEHEEQIELLANDLLNEIKTNIMSKLNTFSTCTEDGIFRCVYYSIDETFRKWDEFYNHFSIGI